MKVGKLDILFIIVLICFLFTWNFGKNKVVYFEIHQNLREQEKRVPFVVINPLAAATQLRIPINRDFDIEDNIKENAESDSINTETEGESSEEEEEETSSNNAEDGNIPYSGISKESEATEKEKEKAGEEARQMMLEDSLLTMKLEDMRKSLEKGLLPADTKFSFQVDKSVSELASLENLDDEELEFVIKLKEKMKEWASIVDQIDRAANNKKLDTDDPIWSNTKFIKDQKEWEENELNRLKKEIRANERETLSGKEVKPPDYYDVEVQNWDEFEEKYGEENDDGNSGDDFSEETDKNGNDNQNNDNEREIVNNNSNYNKKNDKKKGNSKDKSGKYTKINEDTKKDDSSESDKNDDNEEDGEDLDYAQMIKETELEVSYWAQTSKKSILIYGNPAYVHRDEETYSQAFSSAGFEVEKRRREGPLLTKALVNNEFPVLICLALKNDDCFSSSGISKLKRYQRVNRITGLRAVLWSKDSFCKTISSGIKGEVTFASYIFHCWVFPNEWMSAKEYASAHPSTSYIVKPLTMGGGKGITVVDGLKGLSKIRFKTHIVQNYLPNPHLINQHKWDVRSYVLVTSTVPMRAYVYHRGLIRFASASYDPNAKKGGKKSQFLTNTSINKKYAKHNVTEITWSFEDLKKHLEKDMAKNSKESPYDILFKRMQTAISIVFLSAEQEWRRYYHSKGESCHNCFQIMGVDLIVDSEMNPRVIEVNGQPNMKMSKDKNDHYSITKLSMMKDMVHMIFNDESVAQELIKSISNVDDLTLKTLTHNDWLYILEYMKERKHRGNWQKVYPNAVNANMHSQFLEQQKHNPARLALHDILMILEDATSDLEKT